MNLLNLAAAASLALAMVCLLLLMQRRWTRRARNRIELGPSAPLPMRLAMPLALLIEPLIDCLQPDGRRAALTRQFDALGLAHAYTPHRWEAMCVATAMLACGLVALCLPAMGWLAMLCAIAGYLTGGQWLKRRRLEQQQAIARELPAWLDLMTVCVEAGSTLSAGLRLITDQAPAGPLRDFFERVLREIRGGRPRTQAFSHVAAIVGEESLATLASALEHAESSGMSLGQVLRAQAEQRTAERFARAEKLAMQAPVKMLGPLILCIFPCTFIVIGVPIAVRLKEALGA